MHTPTIPQEGSKRVSVREPTQWACSLCQNKDANDLSLAERFSLEKEKVCQGR